jgi:uncharacterized protein (TIGR03437 family)
MSWSTDVNSQYDTDAIREPAVMSAIANWSGGDVTAFVSCGLPAQLSGPLIEHFESPIGCVLPHILHGLGFYGNGQVGPERGQSTNDVAILDQSEQLHTIDQWSDFDLTYRARLSGTGLNILRLRADPTNSNPDDWSVVLGNTFTNVSQGTQQVFTTQLGLGTDKWTSIHVHIVAGSIELSLDGTMVFQKTYTDRPMNGAGLIIINNCCGNSGTVTEIDDFEIDSFRSGPAIVGIYGPTWTETPMAPDLPIHLKTDQAITDLNSYQFLVGGVPATLSITSGNYIDTTVPDNIPLTVETNVVLNHNGTPIWSAIVPVASRAPVVMTTNGFGSGPSSATNGDNTANSPVNPAPPGSVVKVLVAGAGPPVAGSGGTSVVSGRLRAYLGARIVDVVAANFVLGSSTIAEVSIRVPSDQTRGNYPVILGIDHYMTELGATLSVSGPSKKVGQVTSQ